MAIDKKSCFKVSEDKREHNWYYVSLLVFTAVLYAFAVGFKILASISTRTESFFPITSLFPITVGNVFDAYVTDITPTEWAFTTLWTIVLVYQALWLIYALTCLFRRTPDDSLLYREIDFLYFGTLITFSICNIFFIAWLFVWTAQDIVLSLVFLIIITLAFVATLFMSLRKLYKNVENLTLIDYTPDIWITRILVHNGLAFFATWSLMASCLNLAIVLFFKSNVDFSLSGTVALIVVLLASFVYFLLENLIWQRFLLYVVTPWFVVIFTLSGSLARNWYSSKPSVNNIFSLVIVILAGLFAIGKLVFLALFHTTLSDRVERIIKSEKRNRIGTNQHQMNDSTSNIAI